MKLILKKLILFTFITQILLIIKDCAKDISKNKNIPRQKQQKRENRIKRRFGSASHSKGRLKNRIAQNKIYKKMEQYNLVNLKSKNLEPDLLQTSKDAATMSIDLDRIKSACAKEIKLISPDKISYSETMSDQQMNGINKIIFWFTINKIFNAGSFSIAEDRSTAQKAINYNTSVINKTIKQNESIIALSDKTTFDNIIEDIKKACVAVILNKQKNHSFMAKLKNMFWSTENKWNLAKPITKYNELSKLILDNNPNNINHEYNDLIAAEVILFGLHTFKTEINQTLKNFKQSQLLKDIVTIISSADLLEPKETIDEEFKKLNQFKKNYRIFTNNLFHSIMKDFDIKIPYESLIGAEGLSTTPWYFSQAFIALIIGAGSIRETIGISEFVMQLNDANQTTDSEKPAANQTPDSENQAPQTASNTTEASTGFFGNLKAQWEKTMNPKKVIIIPSEDNSLKTNPQEPASTSTPSKDNSHEKNPQETASTSDPSTFTNWWRKITEENKNEETNNSSNNPNNNKNDQNTDTPIMPDQQNSTKLTDKDDEKEHNEKTLLLAIFATLGATATAANGTSDEMKKEVINKINAFAANAKSKLTEIATSTSKKTAEIFQQIEETRLELIGEINELIGKAKKIIESSTEEINSIKETAEELVKKCKTASEYIIGLPTSAINEIIDFANKVLEKQTKQEQKIYLIEDKTTNQDPLGVNAELAQIRELYADINNLSMEKKEELIRVVKDNGYDVTTEGKNVLEITSPNVGRVTPSIITTFLKLIKAIPK